MRTGNVEEDGFYLDCKASREKKSDLILSLQRSKRMSTEDFPLIISPNLGCPIIVSIKELVQGKTIPLIIAGRYDDSAVPLKGDFAGTLYLRPSYPEDGTAKDIPLSIQSNPEEISDWNLLSDFNTTEDTRGIINSELHYNVLGKATSYWKIAVSVSRGNTEGYETLLRKKGEKILPCLYDIVYADKSGRWERVNYHSIQFVESVEGKCNFIHVADPHTAKRNDEILDEVLKVKNRRSREDIKGNYINFNKNMREFIRKANDMADAGELDFVVINGDLVDFSFHGWEDETNPDENNWKSFINIITGAGKEKEEERRNIGLKVAAFTSTGNHDWRLHPYNPNQGKYNETFGLEKEELKHYKYKSFDSSEYPEDERAKLSKEITSKAFNKLNLNVFTFTDKWGIKATKYLSGIVTTWALRVLPVLGLGGVKIAGYDVKVLIGSVILGITYLAIWGIKKYVKYKTQQLVDMIIDNPLHAEVRALHYYLKHINPYLDYAFQYGEHGFIVMDTGADVFVGQLLDEKEIGHVKKMSFEDNILGGSPDSRAFDSEQAYCNWSQIVWLEKVMTAISKKTDDKSKIFAFLHAPPINPPDDKGFDEKKSNLLESNRRKPGWIPEDEYNLTYGTINHYLSQFFYLCMGYRESELGEQDVERKLRQVDIVFSGHAHRNIEFRIEKDKNHEVRIYMDEYSKTPNNSYEWWGSSPVIVQTASCAVHGRLDKFPPYYRKVAINESGQITDFKVSNLNSNISSE